MFGFLKIFVDNKQVVSFGPNINVRFYVSPLVETHPTLTLGALIPDGASRQRSLPIPRVAGEFRLASLAENHLDGNTSLFKQVEGLGIF
jgi:hypothetical protein